MKNVDFAHEAASFAYKWDVIRMYLPKSKKLGEVKSFEVRVLEFDVGRVYNIARKVLLTRLGSAFPLSKLTVERISARVPRKLFHTSVGQKWTSYCELEPCVLSHPPWQNFQPRLPLLALTITSFIPADVHPNRSLTSHTPSSNTLNLT